MASPVLFACLFVLLSVWSATPVEGYRCQETMTRYFNIMTAHNYSMLPSILNESIVWTIPGGEGVLPFNGVYRGPEAVVAWAEIIFDAIDMFYNAEIGDVNTDYQGHISFHDEAITVRKNGRYYRAAVAHEWHFDDNCKATIFNGYYDTMVAVIAYYDGIPYPYPIPSTGPPVFGVDMVKTSEAKAIVEKYENGDESVLADNITVFVPGDQSVFPFAGVYRNKTQFQETFPMYSKMFDVVSARETADMMVQNGNVARYTEYVLRSRQTGKQTKLAVCEHFLINWKLQIQQYDFYYDTYPLSLIIQP